MKNIIAVVAFIIIGWVVYSPVLPGSFVIDDHNEIVLNKRVHTIKNIPLFFTGGTFYDGDPDTPAGVYFRPIKMMWYASIYTFFGPNPYYFHLFQIALHIFNTSILFFIFLTAMPFFVAFLMAAVFLVHPLNVEAIAYIAAVQDPMHFGIGMSGLLFFLTRRRITIRTISILTVVFIFGLFTKEAMLIFGAIYLIAIYLRNKKYVIPTVIMFFFSFLIYSVIFRCKIAHLCSIGVDSTPLGNAPFIQYVAQIPLVLFFYIKSFFFPARLLISQHWYAKSIDFLSFYMPLLIITVFFGLLIAVMFVLYYRESLGRKSGAKKYVIFFSICTIGMLFHSHILPLDFTVADQWFYVPMAGLLGMIGIMSVHLLNVRQRNIFIFFTSLVIVIFSFRSIYRVYMWRDQRALFLHDYQYNKDSYDLANNVGYILVQENKNDEAIKFFIRTTELAPDYPVGWINLGAVYEFKGDLENAEVSFKRAADTGSHYLAYKRYVLLLIKRKKYKEAKIFLEKKALKDHPGEPEFLESYKIVKKTVN